MLAGRVQTDDAPIINMTPMVDVILCLLVFFMAATRFAEEERRIDIKVPTVRDKGTLTAAPDPRIVNVYSDGRIALGDADVTLEELTNRLAAARSQYQGLAVLVRGDRLASHGRMTQIYEACRRAGIGELAISVKIYTKQR